LGGKEGKKNPMVMLTISSVDNDIHNPLPGSLKGKLFDVVFLSVPKVAIPMNLEQYRNASPLGCTKFSSYRSEEFKNSIDA
jgi:hypothetical protein